MSNPTTAIDYGFTANRPRVLRRLRLYLLLRALHAVGRLDGFKVRR